MDFVIPSLQPQLLQRNIISGNGIAISCGRVANKQKIFGIWDPAALAQGWAINKYKYKYAFMQMQMQIEMQIQMQMQMRIQKQMQTS